jgi:hypothetical protein
MISSSTSSLRIAWDLRFALPEYAEELTRPSQQRLWLGQEERLFPSPSHPGQEHQQKPVCVPADGVFELSTQNDQLLS